MTEPILKDEYQDVVRFEGIAPGVYLELHMPKGWHNEPGGHTIARALEILSVCLHTMHEKNKLYAGAWREQGWMGNMARIMSKVTRLRTMLWQDVPTENATESVDDSLLDLINLAIFMALNRQGGNRWGRSGL